MALDSDTRVEVNKLAAILRLANALDADHLQKVKDVKVQAEEGTLVVEVEGAGDLTMERLAAQSRGDFLTEVFGRRLSFREAGRAVKAEGQGEAQRRKEPELFLNRELSWLEFNGRVLEEAMDAANPLLERLKFVTIVAGNLDEFFMVRVAALKNAVEEGDIGARRRRPHARSSSSSTSRERRPRDGRPGSTTRSWSEILPALAERGIRLLGVDALDAAAQAALSRYFRDEILPALTPLAIDSSRPFPMLVLPEPEPRGAPRPRRRARSGRAWPWSRCRRCCPAWCGPPGRRHELRPPGGRHPLRAARTSSRASRCWSPRPSASPATPRWTSTTKAAATS